MKNKELKGEPVPLAYYGRHHLPQLNTNPPSLASKINRNFYRSLRLRGRTHEEIIRMIQPERKVQFLQDTQFICEYMDRTRNLHPTKVSWFSKFHKKFTDTIKWFFTIGGISLTLAVTAQGPTSEIVSVVTEKKDTLFLANNILGCEILDAWAHYPNDRPVIILKSEDWIIREKKRRNKEEDGTK